MKNFMGGSEEGEIQKGNATTSPDARRKKTDRDITIRNNDDLASLIRVEMSSSIQHFSLTLQKSLLDPSCSSAGKLDADKKVDLEGVACASCFVLQCNRRSD